MKSKRVNNLCYWLFFSIFVDNWINKIIVIHLEDEININESIYIELDELVPFQYLQCYEWESLNEEIATVNYIGQVSGVSTGTTQIIDTYKYNFRCSYNNNSKCWLIKTFLLL